MATLKSQIEDLIGAVGDDTLITDSAINTTKEIFAISPPEKLNYFIAKSSSIVNGTPTQVEERKGLKVWRGGVECQEVERGMETKIDDPNSFYHPTYENPVYILDSSGVTIKPDPAGAPNNAYIYSLAVPAIAFDTTIPLTAFPDIAEPLLVYGTAIKCGQRLLTDKRLTITTPPASPTLTIAPSITGIPSPPAMDGISDVVLNFTDTAPSYISPVFTVPDYPTLEEIAMPAPPQVPTMSLQAASDIASPPTYNAPAISLDFADADNWINVEEDDVMAGARLNEIAIKLQQYSNDMQNALNVFNKENAEYQAKLQVELQNAAMKEGKEGRDLQKYQSESQQYASEVQAAINKFQTVDIGEKVAKWLTEYSNRIQGYNSDIQNNLNVFNSDLNEYQTSFQKEIKNADLSIQNNQQSIDKFSQSLSKYTSEVNTKVAENSASVDRITKSNADKLGKYTSDIQKYSIEVQDKQTSYEQILKQIQSLSQLYAQQLAGYMGGTQQETKEG